MRSQSQSSYFHQVEWGMWSWRTHRGFKSINKCTTCYIGWEYGGMFVLFFFFKLYVYIRSALICMKHYIIYIWEIRSSGSFNESELRCYPISSAWTHPQIWFPSLLKCMHIDRHSNDAYPPSQHITAIVFLIDA